MGGSSGSQTTTQRVELPAYENAAREEIFSSARNLYKDYAPQFYPNRTFAQMSPYSQGAVDELAAFGVSPYNQAIQSSTVGTIGKLEGLQQNGLQGGLASPISSAVVGSGLANPNVTAGATAGRDLLNSSLGPNAIAPNILDVNSMRTDAEAIRGASGRDVSVGPTVQRSGPSLLDSSGMDFANQAKAGIAANQGDQNPFVDGVIQRALGENNRQFAETVLPGLRLGAAGNNTLGSTRSQIAEGLAATRLGETNARVAGELGLGAFENSKARELQATGLAGQLATTAESQNQSRLGLDRQFGLADATLRANVDTENVNRDITGRATAAGVSGGTLQGAIGANSSQVNQALSGLNLGAGLTQQGTAEELARRSLALEGANTDAGIRSTGAGIALDAARTNAGFLPVAQQMPLTGTEALLRAGQVDEAYRQQIINDERARFDYYQQLPETKLSNYAALIGGNSSVRPYTTSATAPGGETSPATGALGGAVTGAGLASSLGLLGAANMWNPAGWAMILASAGLGAYSAS